MARALEGHGRTLLCMAVALLDLSGFALIGEQVEDFHPEFHSGSSNS